MYILNFILGSLGLFFLAQEIYKLLLGGYGWTNDNALGAVMLFLVFSFCIYIPGYFTEL